MRVEERHAHADTRYKDISLKDYINLYKNVRETKKVGHLSLNIHIPFELQHHERYTFLQHILAYAFIFYGETLKRIFRVKLYWENAPELVYGDWSLKHGQMSWKHVPRWIDLTLDTGHLMLGSQSVSEAKENILSVLKSRGKQIKHLHIHENDLQRDKHWHTTKIIDTEIQKILKAGRTYIYEKGE